MKCFLSILAVFISLSFLAQVTQKNNTTLTSNQQVTSVKKYNSATTSIALDTLKHNYCLNKMFTIVFYVVQDSSFGVNWATPANLATVMQNLNQAFNPICVSFTNCSTVLIPNFNYGRTWIKTSTEPAVTAAYYTDQVINIFLVDTVSPAGTNELEGYTYYPIPSNLSSPKKDLLVIENWKILQGNSSVINHLLGHYFGLLHTFDEINPSSPAVPPPPSGVMSYEFANGSNCYTHGDGFCDTEADPNSNLILADGMSTYYLHPKDNMMSYYSQRCRFTQEQYNYMAYMILSKRYYLH